MNTITIATLIAATASSTFGAIYLGFWIRQRERRDYLMFALGTFSVAAFSVVELIGMHAITPEEYGMVVRWAHVPGWGMIVFLTWFVYYYLRAGRRWLVWTITILRSVVLILNFILWPNINQRKVLSVSQVSFLGEKISIAQTIPSPWMAFAQISLFLALVFFIDATITAWRRGDRRRAIGVGGTTIFFFTMNLCMAILILWGFIRWPYMLSVFFTGMIVAMAFELGSEVLRTSRLARELSERDQQLVETERQMKLSASAGNVGLWTRKVGGDMLSTNTKWREMYGFDGTEPTNFTNFIARVHPDDRSVISNALKIAARDGDLYEAEYRVIIPGGEVRWFRSTAKVEISDSDATILRGASVDITTRKLAEEATRDLSGKLIDAQETERSRLARELHDGLSQSLALLSIQLEVLGRESSKPEQLKQRVGALTSEIQRLTSDVHRMSHELHPAKLDQLGLEAALRGFCRETAEAHGFDVDFDAKNVPRTMSDDVSLCLYRVAQESLQNVAKHSGASSASVKIVLEDDNIHLTISDDGSGFDTAKEMANGSLGLVSMRERVRSVNGSFEVQSQPQRGTQIRVIVPVAAP